MIAEIFTDEFPLVTHNSATTRITNARKKREIEGRLKGNGKTYEIEEASLMRYIEKLKREGEYSAFA